VPESCTTPDVQLPLPFEEWRPVPGWENRYLVSSMGRVRSLDCTVPCRWGRRVHRGRVLTPALVNGYPRVTLAEDGRTRQADVHHLVLEAFVGPQPEHTHVRHLDGTRSNNALTNLCYGTPKENSEDQARHGTQVRGEAQGQSRLTEAQVRQIRALRCSHREAADMFGVSIPTVKDARKRRTWKHIC
jgi:hypothetical protein